MPPHFGQVHSRRTANATGGDSQKGTLDDQRIFGPLRDLECACGKYRGVRHRGMICDRCGVKVTSPTVRRERFGHIDLGTEFIHPLGADGETITAFPVLPAVFVESPSGLRLGELYEQLIETVTSPADRQVVLEEFVEVLLPVVQVAHEWHLVEAPRLARGLGLEQRE